MIVKPFLKQKKFDSLLFFPFTLVDHLVPVHGGLGLPYLERNVNFAKRNMIKLIHLVTFVYVACQGKNSTTIKLFPSKIASGTHYNCP